MPMCGAASVRQAGPCSQAALYMCDMTNGCDPEPYPTHMYISHIHTGSRDPAAVIPNRISYIYTYGICMQEFEIPAYIYRLCRFGSMSDFMTVAVFKQAGGTEKVLAAWRDIDVDQASGDFCWKGFMFSIFRQGSAW